MTGGYPGKRSVRALVRSEELFSRRGCSYHFHVSSNTGSMAYLHRSLSSESLWDLWGFGPQLRSNWKTKSASANVVARTIPVFQATLAARLVSIGVLRTLASFGLEAKEAPQPSRRLSDFARAQYFNSPIRPVISARFFRRDQLLIWRSQIKA